MAVRRNEKESTTITLLREAFEKNIVEVLKSRSVYGNAWENHRIIYFTDRIASKIRRIQNIENSRMLGETLPLNSSIEEELKDIVSYALMALVRISWFSKIVDGRDWILHYFGVIENE
ncbi:MAG: DUF1599 domain-containing protein [Candidatus Peribacteraceae bacterium]|nr:DUF1599 domain-containing protein [Candidatus Peribacteraceae bacterium]